MAQAKLSEKRKKKIIADYAVEGSYRAAARKNGVSPNTVRRLVLADPESARAAQDKKGACARDILSYMDGQRDTYKPAYAIKLSAAHISSSRRRSAQSRCPHRPDLAFGSACLASGGLLFSAVRKVTRRRHPAKCKKTGDSISPVFSMIFTARRNAPAKSSARSKSESRRRQTPRAFHTSRRRHCR